MKRLILPIFTLVVTQCALAQTITYPTAKKTPVTDVFFDTKVTDDYRWMENLDNPELKKWINDENAITHKFLQNATVQNDTKQDIDHYASSKFHDIQKRGKYYFSFAFYDDISQPALFVRNDIFDTSPRVLVDPNFISHKDKIWLRSYEVSADSKYLAYQYSRNGSDWAEVGVVNIESGVDTKDHLTNVKFSNIAWHNNGFYYSAYPTGANMARVEGQVIYYHKLGTDQSQDEVIFKREKNPVAKFDFLTTKDGRYFVMQEHNSVTKVYNYFYIDYNEAEPALKPLLLNLKFAIEILDSHDGSFIAWITHNAENGAIVAIDPKEPNNWKTIAPSYPEAQLLRALILKDKIVALYQSKMQPGIVVMDFDGKTLYNKTFPMGTSVYDINAEPDDKVLYYHYVAYTIPPISRSLDLETFESKTTANTTVAFDYDTYVYKQVEYPGKDSTKIPMLLVYKRGMKLDAKNPTLLETYGGFGEINAPDFDPGLVYFLEKGGIFAYACVRGEGQLGANWAAQGRGRNKQTSFNDFIAAAEYLEKIGYTNPSKLAITGASNGGLVVAAAAMQRPELFKAVIPVVAPFDMLRFENFTVGSLHEGEYGSVKDPEGYKRLSAYSPYNNIKPTVNYPSMLIITGDHDDRVPPLHSYKFAAAMQNRPAQTNPIYLLVNKQAGHYGIGDDNIYGMLQARVNLYSYVVEMLK